jgi:hypothetical protein
MAKNRSCLEMKRNNHGKNVDVEDRQTEQDRIPIMLDTVSVGN